MTKRKFWPRIDKPCAIRGARWLPLSHRMYALVDAALFNTLRARGWSYSKDAVGTIRIRSGKPAVELWRFILRATKGDGKVVDHHNGDQLDNRRRNLRVTDKRGNKYNSRQRKDSKYAYKGVTYRPSQARSPREGRWFGRISIQGKHHYTNSGGFRTAEEAARSYDDAARKEHGVFAAVNFPRRGERSALTGKIRR